MSNSKDTPPKDFDLRAALTTQADEKSRQQQSHDEYRKVQEREFSRLATDAYNQIRQRLDGIKGITVTTHRDQSLPFESLQIAGGKLIEFVPVDYRHYATAFRGKIEIKEGHQDSKYAIGMTGGQEGNWELAIAEFKPQQMPHTEKFTTQTLDVLLGNLLLAKKPSSEFDLRAALTAQAEERERQQRSHDEYLKVQEREFTRLATDAYNQIRQRLDGIKGLTVTTYREQSLPFDSLQITGSKTIKFIPVDYRQFATAFRGKIEIKEGYQDSKYAIVMTGGQEGNWELAIAETNPRQMPHTENFTTQALDALLGKLLGVRG